MGKLGKPTELLMPRSASPPPFAISSDNASSRASSALNSVSHGQPSRATAAASKISVSQRISCFLFTIWVGR